MGFEIDRATFEVIHEPPDPEDPRTPNKFGDVENNYLHIVGRPTGNERWAGWTVALKFRVFSDEMYFVAATVTGPLRSHVPSALWRAISVDAALAAAREFLPGMLPAAFEQRLVEVMKAVPRPGRAGRSDRFYAEWAERLISIGGRTPAKDLAEQTGLPVSTITHFMTVARQRRLYEPHGQGRPGGELTDLGRAALDEED